MADGGASGVVAHVVRQALAGLSVAVVSLPICFAAGLLAFAPLGGDWLGRGALAALYAAVFSGIAAGLFSRPSPVITSPRASICLVHGSLATALVGRPEYASDPAAVMTLMSLAIVVSGIAQCALGALRITRLVQVAPQPVFAGFLNGVALLIVVNQVLLIAGRSDLHALLTDPPGMATLYPALFVVGFVALGLVAPRFFPRFPPAVVNLILGLALYYALSPLLPKDMLGARLTLPSTDIVAGIVDPRAIFRIIGSTPPLVLLDVALHGLTVALVCIIETLMTLRLAETMSHHRVGREGGILAQGIANLVGAVFAVPSCAGPSQTVVNWMSGGRGRLPQFLASAFLMALLLLGGEVVSLVPVVVLAGHLILIAIGMIDRWSVRQLRRAIGAGDRPARAVALRNVLVMVLVTVATGSGYVVLGAAVGFVVAFAIFITESVQPMIRARVRGDVAMSRRMRPLAELQYLRSDGARKIVLSLQGPLFFGNAVDLAREVESMGRGVEFLVVDFRRVTSVDASTVATLEHVLRVAWDDGRTVCLCAIPRELAFMFADLPSPPDGRPLIFDDRDQALEWCEDLRLAQAPGQRQSGSDAALEATDIVRGFDDEAVSALRRHLVPASYADGMHLCHEGDEGDSLWLVLSGAVRVRVAIGQTGSLRLHTYGPGTLLGEVAFIEGVQRSASLVAEGDVRCLILTRSAFEALIRERPALGMAVLRNVTRVLSERLRVTTDQLRTAEHV